MQCLDSKGQLLWKNTDRGNIWHVAAGNVDGDAKLEVLTTCVTGMVQVFDAEGKHLRDIDPDFYAHMVRIWQPTEAAKQQDLLDQRYSKNQGIPREKPAEFHDLVIQQEASALEQAQMRVKMAERQLESLVKRVREQLRTSAEARKAAGVEETAPVADELIEAAVAKDPGVAELTKMINDMRLVIKKESPPTSEAQDADTSQCLIVVAGRVKKMRRSLSWIPKAMLAGS